MKDLIVAVIFRKNENEEKGRKQMWKIVFLFVIFSLMFGCSNPEKEFLKAQNNKSIEIFEAFIKKNPNHELSQKAKKEIYILKYINLKKSRDIKKIESFIQNFPNGDSINVAKKLLKGCKYEELISTLIAIEDINLLEKNIDKDSELNVNSQAFTVLKGQKTLLSGNLKSIDIKSFNELNSIYEKEFIEIISAIRSSIKPNILKSASKLADKGKIFELFQLLQKMQSIIDNRTMRHTMGQLLYISSQNFKIPQTFAEVNSYQQDLSKFEKKLNSEIKLGSMSADTDFGNVMIIIPTLTIGARARSMLTEIPRREYNSGRIGFNGILQLMEPMGQIAGTINSLVIEGAKMLLSEQYNKLDIKGRYAILQWLEYLIEDANFGVTFRGRIDIDLKKAVDGEKNIFLKDMGLQILNLL